MSYTNPTVSDFKNYFTRDFSYGSDPDQNVLDADIEKGIDEASDTINQSLFDSQEVYTRAFYYLSAHFMVEDLRASSQGIQGQSSWLKVSQNVGSVSESYSIPDYILSNPSFSVYTQTTYGKKYLFMILPLLVGNISAIEGKTIA